MPAKRLSFCWLLWSASFLLAQSNANKSGVDGSVTDATGAPIPGAHISITNEATGLARESVTNGVGMYAIQALDPGTYAVNVDSGSAAASVRRVVLSVGDTMHLNIRLSVESDVQTVDLSAASVATTEPAASELLDAGVISRLPINGRRFQEFATLAPGTQTFIQTRNQLSFSGQRGIYSNVMLDGSDYNEPFLGGIRGGERSSFAFTIPQSAIQEFQVVESGYASEYGRSTGGLLNVVTRSGTNDRHGEAFYQMRPRALSANDPYGFPSLENQHQFGASMGGPVRRDKLFLFGAGEFQIAGFQRNIRFPALDPFAANVTADIAPAYNYFRTLEGNFDQTNNIAALFGRMDYQFGGGSRLTARFNHSQNRAQNAIAPDITTQSQTNRAISTNGDDRDYTDSATLQLTSVLPLWVNDLRLEYSKERAPRLSNSISPYVDAGPIGSFGTSPDLPSSLGDNRVQISETASFVRGRHSASFGADYSFVSAASRAGANQFGSFAIDSFDVRQILQTLSGTAVNRFDDPSVTYLRQVGDLKLGSHAHQAAAFVQDNWRIAPSFTLNYGLRWEGQVNPEPLTDNSFLLSNVQNYPFPLGHVDPSVIRSQLNQWAPRLSFAWDPSGKGNTVLRGTAGLFYGQTPLAWYAGPVNNFSSVPHDLTLQLGPMGANTIYRQFLSGGVNLNQPSLGSLPLLSVSDVWINIAGKPNPFSQANVITTSANNFRNPRSAQLGLLAQHRVSRALVISYQLTHVNTVHLERNEDYNVPAPFVRTGDLSLRPIFGLRSGTLRPNPNLGAVLVRDSSARSNYLAHTITGTYRLRQFQLSAHYTASYNKSDDDNERQVTEISYQNPFDFSRDYNWSNLDSRHQFAGYATWRAPLAFEVSSLFQYRSGLPIDAITGADTSELLTPNFGNRPLVQPGVFMLRNSFRNLDLKHVDLRVAKNFRLKEASAVQLYAEAFNVFNWANAGFIPAILFPNNPAFIYGPGVLSDGRLAPVDSRFLKLRTAAGGFDPATTSQQGTPLEIQLGVRFSF